MADFFSGVRGARFPDVVMNSGPLPPSGGLPAPLHDVADARINYGSTLLGDVSAYAYGEPGYLSSQTGYVNHPHSIQKIIPQLQLPTAHVNSPQSLSLSHAVDDGDIAFCMRLDRRSAVCSLLATESSRRHKLGSAVDPFINLCTLNYLLAGFQKSYNKNVSSKWSGLLHDLDRNRFDGSKDLTFDDLVYIIRELITPFGICRGSEKQGGQHEASNGPATWPVNFVTTLVIDGKDRNVVNAWCHHSISAGDDLVLRLKPMPLPAEGYALNHYYKCPVRQHFELNAGGGILVDHGKYVWQLVPDILTLDFDRFEYSHLAKLPKAFNPAWMQDTAWQETGYWHIGRTQVMCRDYAKVEYYNNDLANTLKTNHLELTFEPSWHEVPKPLGRGKRGHGGSAGYGHGGGGFSSGTTSGSGSGGATSRGTNWGSGPSGYGPSVKKTSTLVPENAQKYNLKPEERHQRMPEWASDFQGDGQAGQEAQRVVASFDTASRATFGSFLDRCKPSAPVLQSKPGVSGVPRMVPGSSGLNSAAGLSTTSSGGGAKVDVFSAAAAMSGLGESAKAKSVTIAGSAGMTSGADTVMSEKKQMDAELTLDIDKIEAQVAQESAKPVAPKRKRKLNSGQLLDHVGNVTEQAFSMVDM